MKFKTYLWTVYTNRGTQGIADTLPMALHRAGAKSVDMVHITAVATNAKARRRER